TWVWSAITTTVKVVHGYGPYRCESHASDRIAVSRNARGAPSGTATAALTTTRFGTCATAVATRKCAASSAKSRTAVACHRPPLRGAPEAKTRNPFGTATRTSKSATGEVHVSR